MSRPVTVTMDLMLQVKVSSEADVEWALTEIPQSGPRLPVLLSAEHSGSQKIALETIALAVEDAVEKRLGDAKLLTGARREGAL